MEPKRILLISYYFAPQNAIGAVRPTKLAKCLERMGHQVTVICGPGLSELQDPTLARDLAGLKDVHVVEERNWLRWLKQRKASSAPVMSASGSSAAPARQGLKHQVADILYRWLRWQADGSFRRRAIRECRGLNQNYDVVFSTYAPMSVHWAACKAKQLGIAKRWIADYRDEVTVPFDWMKGKISRFYRMVQENADVCSAVSDGFLEMMNRQADGRVLSNGFDREDLPAVETVRPVEDSFRVVYCGQVSEGRRNVADRDITPMFRALERMIQEGALQRDQLKLVYAGREGGLFRTQAESCGLADRVEEHGLVPRQESIRLQRTADVLLMSTWYMTGQKGILTGKLFEYMMMDKPIVCCMGGDLKDSPVGEILSETGIGFCCEQAGGQADEEGLTDYVRTLLAKWRDGKPLLDAQNRQAVEAYAYPSLARQLSKWMEEL